MTGDAADVADAVRGTVVACASRAAAAQAAALSGVAESQRDLAGQLDVLEAEMLRVAAVVDSVALDPAAMDPAATAHMADARDSLARSRTRLVTVRGRLGRLRGFEQRERLVGVARPRGVDVEMDEVAVTGRGRGSATATDGGDNDGVREDGREGEHSRVAEDGAGSAGEGRGDGDKRRVTVRM